MVNCVARAGNRAKHEEVIDGKSDERCRYPVIRMLGLHGADAEDQATYAGAA